MVLSDHVAWPILKIRTPQSTQDAVELRQSSCSSEMCLFGKLQFERSKQTSGKLLIYAGIMSRMKNQTVLL